MTAAWFVGARNPVPQDASIVRATTGPIDDDTPAELNAAPEWNQSAADPHTHAGLDSHYVTGFTHESVNYPPAYPDLARHDYNAVIDDQVSSAGRAPMIEATGVWGHGSAQWQESLQPVIRDGVVIGNTVFLSNDMPVQQGAARPMLPDQQDQSWAGVAQQMAIARSRAAFASTLSAADGWQ